MQQQLEPTIIYPTQGNHSSDFKRCLDLGKYALGLLSHAAHKANLDQHSNGFEPIHQQPLMQQQVGVPNNASSYHYSICSQIAHVTKSCLRMKIPFISKYVDPGREVVGSFVAHTIDEGLFAVSQQMSSDHFPQEGYNTYYVR